MLGLVVEGDVVVQRRVNGTGAQSVGDGKEDQHPEPGGYGKAEQGQHREKHAGHGDDPGSQFAGQPVREKARNDGAAGNHHGHQPHIGHRNVKLHVHHRPPGAKQRVRQPKADKRKIDERKQKRIHIVFSPNKWSHGTLSAPRDLKLCLSAAFHASGRVSSAVVSGTVGSSGCCSGSSQAGNRE